MTGMNVTAVRVAMRDAVVAYIMAHTRGGGNMGNMGGVVIKNAAMREAAAFRNRKEGNIFLKYNNTLFRR